MHVSIKFYEYKLEIKEVLDQNRMSRKVYFVFVTW